MKVAAAHFRDLGRTGAGRLVVTVFLLFAFALQSYVTQTHVHSTPVAAERTALADALGTTLANSASHDDEGLACSLCQAIAVAGAFVGPADVALAPLVFPTSTAAAQPIIVGLHLAHAGFDWRSRAPPQS